MIEEFNNRNWYNNYKLQLEILFQAYNISHEKIKLFHDFLLSLYETIDATYMGSDVMMTEEDCKNHFNWCWNKTLESFNKEKIFFNQRGIHYVYFWNFFYEAYYYLHEINVENKIKDYLKVLFDIEVIKTKPEIDILTDWYKILNENLKK
jgi:hypothetical protein